MSCHSWLHCWHTAEVRPTDPPVREEFCCNCDTTRVVPAVQEVNGPSHGPFLAKRAKKRD